MTLRAITILAAFSALAWSPQALSQAAPPAGSQAACQTLNDMTRTVALVRNAQAATTARQHMQATLQLDPVLDRLSVPALLSPDVRNALPQESRAIFVYVSSLREAVEAARDGHPDFAREALAGALGANMANGITALTGYWQCNPNEAGPSLGENASQIDTDSSLGANEAVPPSAKRAQSVADGSPPRDRSSERQGGEGRYFAQDGLVGGNITSFLMMIGLFALTGLMVFLYRSRKKFRARETRRVLNRPVDVRLGPDVSQLLLVDLSMNGAKLQHPGGLEGQRRIDINLNGFWHSALIKWSNPLFAGVMFKTPLDEDTLNTIIR